MYLLQLETSHTHPASCPTPEPVYPDDQQPTLVDPEYVIKKAAMDFHEKYLNGIPLTAEERKMM
ncbi:hypothetical protein DFQ29_002679, partial [Apophysomyces sp. BC1021]